MDRIQGGARRGKLLFHSFDQFNVGQGEEAMFANPRGVSNILTRVTGSLRSNILGTLGVDGKANLFILNPNGIYFGPQARLDIAGSFFASTAAALELGDGVTFQADMSAVPNLLTLRVPVGVQFGEQPGNIVNEGQLQTGRDLILAGDRLILSGELRSGRNLVLRSRKPIRSEARFLAGRDFKIEGVDETFGKLVSPDGQVILADGNVAIGAYVGGSLHILAGGSVRLGRVWVEESGAVEATINPNNDNRVNGRLTYADLASVEIPGVELKTNETGRLKQVPKRHAIAIDGSKQATLDVRAGVDWDQLKGTLKQSKVSGDVSWPDNGNRTSRIVFNGNARINQPKGQVLLTNRFKPNRDLKPGAIVTRKIDTSVEGIELDAGDVSILGRGNIFNSLIDASSTVALDDDIRPLNSNENSGDGGDVIVDSISGNIQNKRIETSSTGILGSGGE